MLQMEVFPGAEQGLDTLDFSYLLKLKTVGNTVEGSVNVLLTAISQSKMVVIVSSYCLKKDHQSLFLLKQTRYSPNVSFRRVAGSYS